MTNFNDTAYIEHLMPMRYQLNIICITFGGPAILTNVTIFLVLFSNKKLLAKSAMIAGLAGGNLFLGICAFGSGVYRMLLLLENKLDLPASTWFCMASMLPTCFLLGYSLPAAMQFLIGLERLLAVGAFNWYRVNWSSKKSWRSVLFVYCVCICFWVIPVWVEDFSSYRLGTKECSSGMVINQNLIKYLIRFIIAAGTFGVACVLVAILIGRWRFKNASSMEQTNVSHLKRQIRLSRLMFFVVMFDFWFVVFPNILSDLKQTFAIPSFFTYISTAIYCCNAMTNVFINLAMNIEFRKAALATLRKVLPKCFKNEVTPVIQ